uniref:Uncharacterized protein n=1 Tax=Peronospora matthiolae TaxID=2874970 RepID=A0AAV1VBF5_9STRA
METKTSLPLIKMPKSTDETTFDEWRSRDAASMC